MPGVASGTMATVVDRAFSDPTLAALYDSFCAGRPDFGFYLPLVMATASVLDVGCGTGELLRLARAGGHQGRLCGLDPARSMLEQARVRRDVEWVLGDAASMPWRNAFDLVVMTGHAFQVLVDDDELRAALAAIHGALTDCGQFVFETRNPTARAWEHWTSDEALEIVDANGWKVRMAHAVDTPLEIDGRTVSFTVTYSSPSWEAPRLSHSTLRFLGVEAVAALLSEAGFAIEDQFGDWNRAPLAHTSPEVITIASRRKVLHR